MIQILQADVAKYLNAADNVSMKKLPCNFSMKIDESLSLRSLGEEDAEVLFNLVDANRAYLREFLGWLDYNTTTANSLAFIKQAKVKWEKLESLTFAIYLSQTLVGLVSLDGIDHLNHSASIGYWIDQKYQGLGIMTKSTRALMQFAFAELKLHRLELKCALHNDRSRKVAEKLGFEREGLLKGAIAHYGQYFDAYIYGIINLHIKNCIDAAEWEMAKKLRDKYFFDPLGIPDPYTSTFEHKDHVHFILYQDAEMIGYAHIQLWPDHRAALRIFVLDEHQRHQGFGSRFLQLCEEWLKKEGVRFLHDEARPDSVNFYRKNGYTEMPFDDPSGEPPSPHDIAMGKKL